MHSQPVQFDQGDREVGGTLPKKVVYQGQKNRETDFYMRKQFQN